MPGCGLKTLGTYYIIFLGIIAEYDPFHNGHAWQLQQAKALGAQRVAVAMSCGLTQRGALPLLPESVRVQAALTCGADLVFGNDSGELVHCEIYIVHTEITCASIFFSVRRCGQNFTDS